MASKKKVFSLFIFLVLLISFPLILLVVKLQQDYRSRAYIPSTTPFVTTDSLPNATQGVRYQENVSGLDTSGYGSALTLSLTNLPAGLSKGACKITPLAETAASQITCQIIGTPAVSGAYNLVITISNGRTGLLSTKVIPFLVQAKP
jgi:hypothetical protein